MFETGVRPLQLAELLGATDHDPNDLTRCGGLAENWRGSVSVDGVLGEQSAVHSDHQCRKDLTQPTAVASLAVAVGCVNAGRERSRYADTPWQGPGLESTSLSRMPPFEPGDKSRRRSLQGVAQPEHQRRPETPDHRHALCRA